MSINTCRVPLALSSSVHYSVLTLSLILIMRHHAQQRKIEIEMADGAASLSSSLSLPSAGGQQQSPAAASTTQNPLSRKLNKILENTLDNDRETLEALDVLSGFLEKNTLQARRNLRSDLEQRSLALNESFLQCITQLVDHVRGLQEETATMKVCCDDMRSRLTAAKTRTSGLLRETAELQAKSRQLEMKSKVVGLFLDKFELTSEELEIITHRSHRGVYTQSSIDERFFEVIKRVKHIHEDCKTLLRTSQQRAGLEIMEAMAMHLESAYEQLYHWTQSQCRLMIGECPESSATLRQALGELRQRPVLFQYCVDEYSIARRIALVQSFIGALTREGNTGGRPIELHSHDPVRYCSDMLGWLHQAIATEKDHIAGLLSETDDERTVSILSMVTEGACRPLHVRVEQVLVSTVDAVVGYQLVNLLRYYVSCFRGLLGSTAPLVQTVADLTELQSKMFFSALNVQTAKILDGIEAPLPDLAPTPKASELLALLQRILSSRDMTVLASTGQEQDLRLILSTCIDPTIQYCSDSVTAFTRFERAVYLINCLYLMQTTVSLYEFTERQLELLDAQIQSHLEVLVGEQTNHFLSVAGLHEFHTALRHGAAIDEEHFKLMDSSREQLVSLVSAPEHHLLAQSRLLSSARLREEMQRTALEKFSDAYAAVHAALVTERGEQVASRLLSCTPDQVGRLLD